MTEPAYNGTAKHLNQVVKTSWEGAHPDIVDFYRAMEKEMRNRGVPVYAFEMVRSAARQNELKAQGRSKASAGSSPHQYGCAVDIVHAKKFWDLTPTQWSIIGAIGKEVARKRKIKVTWGGDWDFYDPAHWQLTNWKRYKAHFDAEGETPTTEALSAFAATLAPKDR